MKKIWKAEDIPDLSGKVIVITGANSGIGFEATREFARNGAEVIFASRIQEKAEQAILTLQQELPGSKLKFIKLDLANLESIRKFAEIFKKNYHHLDILLNNAGIMLVPYSLTDDGFEKTIGTNHLGHFALTGLLLDSLIKTPGARVVTVSSNAHYGGEMDFSNLMFEEKLGYTPMKAYSRSKLANLLFTYELQRLFQKNSYDTLALAAHPGISATGLADHLFFNRMTWLIQSLMRIIFQSAAMGALPSMRAAVDPDALGGQYYGPDGKRERSGYPIVVDSNEESKNEKSARQLWKISEELTGIQYLV
ncbi:MAG: SDR family NAD(P)-dependent oxidoreductase [Anaerolineales bacterium]|nr:MAG: SDR family NAD(P)-dependent oxidoreductase [Anaerolineales bacterium]